MSSSRKTWGWVLTAVWLFGVAIYVAYFVGWLKFQEMKANEIGDFLAGTAAPLAFFWLVLGYLQQGEELRLQREQLELQRRELQLQREETKRLADEAYRQASAIEANELHARKDTFLRVLELTSDELTGAAMTLYIRFAHPEQIEHAQLSYSRGDKDIYFRLLTNLFIQGKHVHTLEQLKKYMDWPSSIGSICERFEQLVRQAKPCDQDGFLVEHLQSSPLGKLAALLRQVLERDMVEGQKKKLESMFGKSEK